MKSNLSKQILVLLIIFAFSFSIGFAATATPPKIKVDLGKINLGELGGTGQINIAGLERGVVNYAWQKRLNFPGAFSDIGLRVQVGQIVESYLYESGSLERANELIAATVLASGYDYCYTVEFEKHQTYTASSLTMAYSANELARGYGAGQGQFRWDYLGSAEAVFGSFGSRLKETAGGQGWMVKTKVNDQIVAMVTSNGEVWGIPGAIHRFTDLEFIGGTEKPSWGNVPLSPEALQRLMREAAITPSGAEILGSGIIKFRDLPAYDNPWLGQVSSSQQGSGDFNPFDIAGVRSRLIPGRDGGTDYTALPSAQTKSAGKVFFDVNNQGVFDVEVSAEGVYTECQVFANAYVTPLVLDLDGDGKLSASRGEWLPHPDQIDTANLRYFDLDANSFPLITEWVGKGDGLLCEPKADGSVDGSCLFGSMGGYQNGFVKLSLRDENQDRKLSGKELEGLFAWQDSNSNAGVDKGELQSLTELGISRLNLEHNNLVSGFIRNGREYLLWDWFPNCLNLMKVAVRKI